MVLVYNKMVENRIEELLGENDEVSNKKVLIIFNVIGLLIWKKKCY